jgi:S1-C subfamily serine protease
MDLILYLETGRMVHRHYDGCYLSAMGVMYKQAQSGLEVRRVNAGSFGEQAGLEVGDRIVRLAGSPVFTRADIWQQIGLREPGSEITVEFIRGRELMTSSGKLISATQRAIGE